MFGVMQKFVHHLNEKFDEKFKNNLVCYLTTSYYTAFYVEEIFINST